MADPGGLSGLDAGRLLVANPLLPDPNFDRIETDRFLAAQHPDFITEVPH